MRPVAARTGAVVAPSGVLADLIVATLVGSVPALVDVCGRPHAHMEKDTETDPNTYFSSCIPDNF